MVSIEKVEITNLLVNPENYRYDPVETQREAIENVVGDQGNKLFNLAEDILLHGLNPNDKIQISKSHHNETKYIVLEGNRRVVALKLLFNPNLLEDGKFPAIKKKFEKLNRDHKSKIITHIECNYYEDPKEADHWIGIKHGSGNEGVGTEKWTSWQKERYEEKINGTTGIALQAINLLRNSKHVSDELKRNINNVKLTNFNRLLSDPNVRSFLGIEYANGRLKSNIKEVEVVKGLEKIAKDCLDPNFKVRNIYSKDDRLDYLKKIPKKSKPNIRNKTQTPWEFSENDNKGSATTSKKSKVSPKDRKKMIPHSCKLSIGDYPKINKIYHELQSLPLDKYTNAGAVLLRVFIELSVDVFMHKRLTTIPKQKNGYSLKLKEKINHVIKFLKDNNLVDEKNDLKGINVSINNPNSILGIDTWHAYIHNSKFSPIQNDLNTTWDNIQPFVEKLWENIV